MRESLHPPYPNAQVKCACGAAWETRSTSGDMHLDICSSCHPFYTGKQKLMDTQGRIDRFNKRYANTPKPVDKPKVEDMPKAEPKAAKAPASDNPKKAKAEKPAGEKSGSDKPAAEKKAAAAKPPKAQA